MKHFYLIVLLFGGLCHADTLVAEFAGFARHGLPDDVPAVSELVKIGFQDGDLIRGSFAYQSDAQVTTDFPDANPRGSNYPVDYLRIQFGDTVVEDTEDVIMAISNGTRDIGNFAIRSAKPSSDPLTFAIQEFGGLPVTTEELPLSTEDVDATQRWLVRGLMVSFDFDSETAFTISSSPCDPTTAGDIDGDGQVGFSDFLMLSDNFGDVVTRHELGDIDCSGLVDFADFLSLSSNFGREHVVSNVPEPSSSALSLFALCICLSLRIAPCTMR